MAGFRSARRGFAVGSRVPADAVVVARGGSQQILVYPHAVAVAADVDDVALVELPLDQRDRQTDGQMALPDAGRNSSHTARYQVPPAGRHAGASPDVYVFARGRDAGGRRSSARRSGRVAPPAPRPHPRPAGCPARTPAASAPAAVRHRPRKKHTAVRRHGVSLRGAAVVVRQRSFCPMAIPIPRFRSPACRTPAHTPARARLRAWGESPGFGCSATIRMRSPHLDCRGTFGTGRSRNRRKTRVSRGEEKDDPLRNPHGLRLSEQRKSLEGLEDRLTPFGPGPARHGLVRRRTLRLRRGSGCHGSKSALQPLPRGSEPTAP